MFSKKRVKKKIKNQKHKNHEFDLHVIICFLKIPGMQATLMYCFT